MVCKRSAGVALAMMLAVTAVGQAAGPGTNNPQLPRSGDHVAYAFSFEGRFGANQPDTMNDTISIDFTQGQATLNSHKMKPLTLQVKANADGSLEAPKAASPLGDIVYDYNAIVSVIVPAPHPLNGSWKATLPVRVSPDTWNNIPVTVHTKQQGDTVELEAVGKHESVLFFKGFTFPINVTATLRETFGSDGHLRSATFLADELTQGGFGPKISYNWRFDAR